MNNATFFITLILLVLSAMLNIRLSLHLDLKSLDAVINVKLFWFKILRIKVDLAKLLYSINNGKQKRIKLLITKEDKYLLDQIKNTVINKIYFESNRIQTYIGLNSPYSTAIIVGLLDNCERFLSVRLFKSCDLYYYNAPFFDEDKLSIDIFLNMYITIFDLVFALIISFYKRGKYGRRVQETK